MSRRKRRSAHDSKPAADVGRDRHAPRGRRLPEPNPPRPNKLLLVLAAGVLVLWIACLAVLAVATCGSPQ